MASKLSPRYSVLRLVSISKFLLISTFLLVYVGTSHPQNTSFRIVAGSFSPTDWAISGMSGDAGYIDYDNFSWPWNMGFGDAWEFGFSCERQISHIGLRVELGARHHENRARYGTFEEYFTYIGKLDVYWMESALIYRLSSKNSRFSPYFGFGPGLYVAKITQETRVLIDGYLLVKLKSDTPAPGIRLLTGFDYDLFGGLFFCGELGYSFIQRDFDLEDPDEGDITRVKDLNIGGTSLRFGIGYEF